MQETDCFILDLNENNCLNQQAITLHSNGQTSNATVSAGTIVTCSRRVTPPTLSPPL